MPLKVRARSGCVQRAPARAAGAEGLRWPATRKRLGLVAPVPVLKGLPKAVQSSQCWQKVAANL